MSLAQNSHLTNKPEDDGALILPPPHPFSLPQCSVLQVFKACTERKEVERRISGGHTWESNSGPPAQKALH